ncbi:MAG: Tetratricopeptide 2 repeat protein [Deltaproteobacteria bacterium]|nr:Tetratricopeptide 2 repeat protein [Deltaproteobacteria bacterium]
MRRLRFLLAVSLATASLPSVTSAAPDDWGVQRDPFDRKVIGTYKAILVRNPHDAAALAKLLELYRRYRTVDLLKEEYGKVLEKQADDWATLVVLGHLHRKTGDDPRALEMWGRAVAKVDTDAATWLAIGEIHKASGKNKDARAAYEKALALSTAKDMKKKALRALADLALATSDIDAANGYFKQFLDLDPKNASLWIERGDAMLAAGKRDIALESYSAAEKLLGGDPSKRIEVVARRGQALEGMGNDDGAVTEYRRAIKLAPKGYYLEVELTGRIIDIYRRKQALPALLAQYEKEWPEGARGHFEWSTLGKLYEETGAQDKAITALKKAVAKAAWELDTQRRLIALLQNSGKDDEALAQYEAVVRVAPGEARFQLDLADRYQGRGQEKKALEVLARLQARFPSDAGVLSAIADLYQRWGKEDLAIAQYERLAKLEPDDPGHLVTLGEQYWQKQDKVRALTTWKRLVMSGKASGFAKLGEVMQEHNMPTDALANYGKAIKLDDKNAEFHKGRAAVYESQKNFQDAVNDWEKVLALLGNKSTDRSARRDARRRYVSIITRWGAKEQQYKKKWTDGFAAGSDIESGYLLVEYYGKRHEKDQPTRTLELLHKKAPDDQEVVLDLVKSYKDARRFDEAIALLLELAKAAPSREREVYNQIADIKIAARKDNEATEWRMKAVAKNPLDPAGYEHLAEGFVAMQQFAEAITAYEKVLQLDPRNSKALFALAQLHIQGGSPAKAAELLRGVLRTASDDEVVGRAGRDAIDLEEMTDTLGELEKVLSPLSFMMAHKPVYRHVLVDLYLRYVPRLVERERHGNEEIRKAARAELTRIGGHGLQPLLEALRDEKDVTQQRVAVAVLGHLGNKGAAAPLVHMARQEPPKDARHIGTLAESLDREVRVDALVAAGRLGDPKVLVDVLPLMDHPEVAMREAATFTLGRSGDRRAIPALLKALTDRRPSVQTLACLGLAQIDDPRVAPVLISTLNDARKEDSTRAACAYAIGARHANAGIPALLGALTDNRGEAQRLAAWSLGQLGDPKTLGPLIRAYFARAGRSSDELVWAIGRVSGTGLAPAPAGLLGDYPLGRGKYDPIAAVAALPGALPQPPMPGKLVIDHADDISRGLLDALGEHRDVVVSVLSDLDNGPAQLSLGSLASAGTATDPRVNATLTKIAEIIAPAIYAQLASEDPKVRSLAISVVAKLEGGKVKGADEAVAKALADPADQVRASAMNSVAVIAQRRGKPPIELVTALVKTLASGAWADRRGAAFALGKLGAAGDPGALVRAAGDSSSFVREAIASALATAPTAGSVEALLKLSRDEVPQVRAAAAHTLGSVKDDRAQKRRGELATDPDPIVRQAAGA